MSDEFYFDPEQQEGSHFELLPVGDYSAEIVDAVISQPKSGDGHMLSLTWKICDGDYEKRQIWQRLCYQHSNPTTQDMARRFLKDLCTALDINQQITDPEVFKFKPVRVRVGIESDKNGQYDDQNNIKRVHPLSAGPESASSPSAVPLASKPAPKPASKPSANKPGTAPWNKPTA
jgi:hypothetical protein